jgi:hypothetical protein
MQDRELPKIWIAIAEDLAKVSSSKTNFLDGILVWRTLVEKKNHNSALLASLDVRDVHFAP